jgi:hypothetical protein
MIIPSDILDRLRNVGLLVSEPFVATHVAYPDGCVIAKPATVRGNHIAGYEGYWGDGDILIDAPSLFFHADPEEWIVTAHEYVPGPGPGDFVHCFPNPDAAVADILDFFFGDPSRMAKYER